MRMTLQSCKMLRTLFCVLVLLWSVSATGDNHSEQILSKWGHLNFVSALNISKLQPKCKIAINHITKRAKEGDFNALRMLDASAKLPSGILSGNVNQYGDFDECMDVPEAQYCLAELDFERVWRVPYSSYKSLVHSYFPFREHFGDPAHRLPGFKMVRWGFCIPVECSSQDLELVIEKNVGAGAHIRPHMCQRSAKEARPITMSEKIVRLLFCTVVLAVLSSTLIDSQDKWKLSSQMNPNAFVRLLMCFSLKKNVPKLFEIKEETSSEIAGLHGIRSLSAFALLMSHKSVTLLFNPYVNRTAMIKTFSQPWTIMAKNAIVYTDCFMLISGLLNANSLLADVLNNKSMKFGEKLISRLFRILPNFIAIILFCTYILPSFGSGPLWPTVVDHHSVLCKKYMWRNVLFIHNYFGFENMCLTHTHQLGIDMQLFIVTPILIYFVSKSKTIGLSLLIVIGIASTMLRYWVIYANELSSVVYFGISVTKMFEMANLSYILPTHRATIYVTGVFLACMLKLTNPRSWTKVQLVCLWTFFLSLFFICWLGPYHMAREDYVYNRSEAAAIAALTPVLWGGTLAVAIYAMNTNLGGWLTNLLCWKYFQFLTKIGYSLYLVQFPIFFYNVGLTRHIDEYKPYFLVLETTIIVLASMALTLFVEMPFQNIRRFMLNKKKEMVASDETTAKDCNARKYKSG